MSALRRSLVSLVVIALASGLTVLAWRLRPPPPPPPGASNVPLLDVDPADVVAVEVRSWHGRIAADRGPDGWRLRALALRSGGEAAPARTPSPPEIDRSLEEMVEGLLATPRIDAFPRGGEPLAAFGLDRPQATLRFRLAEGGERVVEVGDLTATGAALYGRVLPADEIVVVGTLIFNDVQATLYRLRALAEAGTSRRGSIASSAGPASSQADAAR